MAFWVPFFYHLGDESAVNLLYTTKHREDNKSRDIYIYIRRNTRSQNISTFIQELSIEQQVLVSIKYKILLKV